MEILLFIGVVGIISTAVFYVLNIIMGFFIFVFSLQLLFLGITLVLRILGCVVGAIPNAAPVYGPARTDGLKCRERKKLRREQERRERKNS